MTEYEHLSHHWSCLLLSYEGLAKTILGKCEELHFMSLSGLPLLKDIIVRSMPLCVEYLLCSRQGRSQEVLSIHVVIPPRSQWLLLHCSELGTNEGAKA